MDAMTIVYELHGGPYDGDFVGFQKPREELDVALPPVPLKRLLQLKTLLQGMGPIHVNALASLQAAAIQPRRDTYRIGRYVARPKQPLILDWQGEVEPKGEE
jgi:hypothetical protein